MPEVDGQSDLGRLVLQVAAQMGVAYTAWQVLLVGVEELFDHIVAGFDHLHRAACLVGQGMAGESVTVGGRIAKHDVLGLEAAARTGGPWLERLEQLVVVALDVC
ncbi:MAG: hypothetical protein OXN97_16475 [Bryobacterales bacterium]|nr:hypothetical protein [Bryobacterales bacterium]